MITKKSPTPVKKAAPKKKIVSRKPVTSWKMTGEYTHPLFPGCSVKISEMPDCQPTDGKTRVSELEAENYTLRTLLSKHQSEPMQQIKEIPPQRATMLNQFAEQLDGQLSRLYNSLNTLNTLANRLLIQKEDSAQGSSPEAHDLSTRYSNILTHFSNQNDRLDFLTTKLSDLI